jgi:hypothetical protein
MNAARDACFAALGLLRDAMERARHQRQGQRVKRNIRYVTKVGMLTDFKLEELIEAAQIYNERRGFPLADVDVQMIVEQIVANR